MIKTDARNRFFWGGISDEQNCVQTERSKDQARERRYKRTDHRHQQIVTLVENAKAGSREALEQLASMFHKDIFRMVYYRTGSQMDAEDLTQEIFIQVVRSLPGLRDANCFKSWLFRIALNRVKDFHRKKSLQAFLGLTTNTDETEQISTEEHDDAVHYIMRKEFWKQFHALADCLSRWEREIFLLRFVDHLEIREIAETLKKNENTVKTHLYRALKKFRNNSEFRELLQGEL